MNRVLNWSTALGMEGLGGVTAAVLLLVPFSTAEKGSAGESDLQADVMVGGRWP